MRSWYCNNCDKQFVICICRNNKTDYDIPLLPTIMTKKRLCYCHGSHHCHPDQIKKLSQKFKKQISAEINQLKISETSILNSKNVLFHEKQNSEYLKIGNYIPNISDLSIKSSTSTCSLHDFCFFRQTYDNKLNYFSFVGGVLTWGWRTGHVAATKFVVYRIYSNNYAYIFGYG